MIILTINCWSFSVRYQLFDWDNNKVLAGGTVERVIIGDSYFDHELPGSPAVRIEQDCPDHRTAIELILRTLTSPELGALNSVSQINAVGHRVAHGGEKFTHSLLIDNEVMDAVREMVQLAPQHNANNIAGIEAAQELLPGIPHVAVFDTAFHQTMPEHAFIYPLPHEWYEQYGVRRYGFHGASHLFVSRRAAALLGKPASQCNMITLHIGKGASLCAIRNGASIDTSMGLTPIEGAAMGTRCGDIDPGIPPFIMQEKDVSPREMDTILNMKSGMLGITGRYKDRRDIIREMEDGDERCSLAFRMEAYRLKKYIGAYLAAVGPLDALVFTAGVGVMAWQIREETLAGLEIFGIVLDKEANRRAVSLETEMDISTPQSRVKIFVIPTAEELVFAEDTAAILAGTYTDPAHFPYSFAQADFKRTYHLPDSNRRAAGKD
ncbi:acetate kinase [Geotalea sp. SG265]|uniref:acetate kinase n=1 Tax=Geotalea sp. SG265 TaxID=2922867 RepID=UPI001FAF7249